MMTGPNTLTDWMATLLARVRPAWAGKFTRHGTAGAIFATAGIGFVAALLSAIGAVVAARILSPAGRGELAAAIVWASILTALATLGLPQALTYHVARAPEAVGRIFSTTLVLVVAQSFAALAIGYLASGLFLAHTEGTNRESVRIYLLSVPFSLLTTYVMTMAQGLRRFGLFNLFRLTSAGGYVLGFGLAAIVGIRRAQPVIWLLLGAQVLVAFINLGIFIFQVKPKGGFSSGSAKRLLSYGVKSYWGGLSWMANARLDQLLMSSMIGLTELGQYAVAVSYGTATFPLSASFAMVLFPRVAGDALGQATEKIKKALRYNLAISSAMALALGIACPWLLPLIFGTAYQNAVVPALILLPAAVFLGCNYVLSDGVRGLGAPLVASYAEMLAAGITIVGLFILLPALGIVGAALVSLLAYATVTVLLVFKLRRMSASEASDARA